MLSEKGISGPKFKNLHFFLFETLKLEKLKKADLKYGNRLFSNSSLDVVNPLSASVALIQKPVSKSIDWFLYEGNADISWVN